MTARRWSVLAVAAALAVANLLIQGLRFEDTAVFNAEAERDLDRTLRWVTGGPYPAVGPEIHPTSFNLGSMAYLLLSVPVAVNPDPGAVRWTFVLLGSAALALLVVLLTRVAGLEVAALFGAWLLASELWFDSLRRLWHSSLIPVFASLVFLALERFLSGRSARWFVVAAVAAGVCVQLHAVMAPLFVVLAAVAVAHRRRLGWRTLLAAAGLVVLVSAPLLAGLFAGGGDPAYARSSDAPAPELSWIVELVGRAVTPGYGSRSWLGFAPRVAGVPVLAVLLPALAAAGAVSALRRGSGLDFPRVVLLSAALGLGVQPFVHGLGTTPIFSPHDLTFRYLHVALVPLFVLAAIGASALVSRAAGLRAAVATLALGLVLLGLVARPDLADADGGWCRMRRDGAIASWVVEDVGIAAADAERRVHGTTCRGRSTGWRYLYRVRRQDRVRAVAAREQDLHAVVLPAELDAEPAAAAVVRREELTTGDEPLRLWVVRSAIDYRRLQQTVDWAPAPDGLPRPSRTRIDVPISEGPYAVHIVFRAAPNASCPVTATRGAEALVTAPLAPIAGHAERLVRVALRGHGPLRVSVGPCELLEGVDVF